MSWRSRILHRLGDAEEVLNQLDGMLFGVRFDDGKAADLFLGFANGPSVTVTLPFDKRTRAPEAVGRQPSTATR